MAEIASAFVSLVPSAKGFGRGLESQVGGEVRSSGSRLGGVLSKGLKVGLIAGGAAVGAVGAAFVTGLKGAAEYEKITARTANVIKTTGGAAGVTAKQVAGLGSEVEGYSALTNEAVESGANLLLTFTNIKNQGGKNNDIFSQTTKLSADLAVAMGTDVPAAALQLGKALNDPAKGYSRLQRSGVSFTESQIKQIKTLQANGDILGAQKLILGEVQKEFGGAAKAAGGTFAGSLTRLKNQFGDLLRDSVMPLLPTLTKVVGFLANRMPGAFAKVSSVAKGFMGSLAPIGGVISGLFASFSGGGAGGGISTFVNQFATIGKQILPSLTALGVSVGKTFVAIGGFIKALLPTIVSIGSKILATLGPAFKQIAGVVSTQLLPAFRAMLPVLLPVAKFLLNMFGSALIGAIKGVAQAVVGIVNVIAGVFKLVVALVHGDWAGAWNAVVQIVKGVINAVVGAVRAWFNIGILAVFKRGVLSMTGLWRGLWNGIRNIASGAAATLRGLVSKLVSGLAKLFVNGVKAYVNIWKGLFKTVISLARTGLQVLRSAFGGALAAIRTVVSGALSKVRGAFSSAWSAIRSGVSAGFSRVVSAARSGIGNLVSVVGGIPGKILRAVGKLGGLLKGEGVALVNGLVAGISSVAHRVTDFVSNLIGKIPKKIRSLMGIASPSKVTTKLGAQIGEGLAVGIAGSQASVDQATSRLVGNLKGARAASFDAGRFNSASVGTTSAGNTFYVTETTSASATASEVARRLAFAG